jgi:aspartate carbamoyltransferase catalytic subunit
MNERLFHVIRAQQFDRELLEDVFNATDEVRDEIKQRGVKDYLKGKVMATLFYEPSTRTRLSFEAAMLRLGGCVVGTENAKEFSSAIKGETLKDTIRIIAGYSDVIVLRHFENGASEDAESAIESIKKDLDHRVAIINAGDGTGQHPTQAILDMYTIWKELKEVDGLKIAMCGDLKNGRTVRSLAYLLAKHQFIKIFFVAPPELQMQFDIRDHLRINNIAFEDAGDIKDVAGVVDVIYQTRVQKERGSETNPENNHRFRITRRVLDLMPEHAIVMHPLPRVDEISEEVDSDPRAAYFRQAHNGLYVRMALLKMIFNKD